MGIVGPTRSRSRARRAQRPESVFGVARRAKDWVGYGKSRGVVAGFTFQRGTGPDRGLLALVRSFEESQHRFLSFLQNYFEVPRQGDWYPALNLNQVEH
jgi:hypothetical protein